MTIDEALLREVDVVTRQLGTTRSEFIREALHLALQRLKAAEREHQHRAGYMRQPVEQGEFDGWEAEQAWGND